MGEHHPDMYWPAAGLSSGPMNIPSGVHHWREVLIIGLPPGFLVGGLESQSAVVLIVASVCAAVPPTIAALAAYRKSKQAVADVAKVEEKTDGLVAKTEQIHVLTNSNLALVKAELAVANEQIRGLQEMVTSLSDRSKGKDVAP